MSVIIPTGKGIQLKVEDGFTAYGPELMADSGDRKTYTSAGSRFSLCAKDENGIDRRPVVRPDGLRNGCLVSPPLSGIDNGVDVCAGSIWNGGAVKNVSAVTDLAVTRPSAGSVKKVSIAVDSTGTVEAFDGTEGAAYSDSRGVAGGPPYIPLGTVELAKVKLDEFAGPVTDESINFSPELSTFPVSETDPYLAKSVFSRPFQAIHTGGVACNIYITYCVPQFSALDPISFRPPSAVSDGVPSGAPGKLSVGQVKNGKVVLAINGTQLDLRWRIAGSVRLFEFMPEASGTRREIFYAYVESGAEYRPGEILTGEFLLTPVKSTVAESI
jgi:hypothetical protein